MITHSNLLLSGPSHRGVHEISRNVHMSSASAKAGGEGFGEVLRMLYKIREIFVTAITSHHHQAQHVQDGHTMAALKHHLLCTG